jgi:small-conductance mechanosensitive channel
MPLDDDTSESEASSSVRSTAAVQRQPDKQNAAANEQDAVPEQPRSELEQLTAENTALRAALSEEEKRNAELLALVRRADKEMQDITQRDRDLAGRLAKWREEVRDITYS